MAYSVKYETILVAEKLKKREGELAREKDAITILKAEWQLLNRPARLQALAAPEPGVQQLLARQIVRVGDIPQAKPEGDKLGTALDGLLTGSIPAAENARKATGKPVSPPGANVSTRPVQKVNVLATPRPTPAKAVIPAKALPKVATSAPLSLQPPPNRGVTPKTAPKIDPIATLLSSPVPPKSVGAPAR